jgi:pantoate--beta-alanine ligase
MKGSNVRIIKTVFSMQSFSHKQRQLKKTIGFVPTMGFLHEGHLALIRRSRRENDLTVLSIFVNPLQFGPQEDYLLYPRDKKRDELFAKKEKIDIIFYPSEKEMYPTNFLTTVHTAKLSEILCGQSRPKHFIGVTTIVAKLLNAVLPDNIYLGQKDAQQAIIIKKMILDLNWPVHVKIVPTIREHDGLAMSSRNKYLSSEEREQSTCLIHALIAAKIAIRQGERNVNKIFSLMKAVIKGKNMASIDYLACVNKTTLEPVTMITNDVLILLAVYIGKTRLIDNMIIRL